MKIGMFSDSYLPYASGVVRSVETFTDQLRRLGDDVYIFAPGYPGFIEDDADIWRFPSYRFSSKSDFRLAFPYDRRLIDNIRRLKLDLIHTHSPFLLGYLAARLSRTEKTPIIFTHHTLYSEYVHYFKWLPRPVTKHLVNWYVVNYCQQMDTVIAPTQAISSVLVGLGVTRPIEILDTGVDLDELSLPPLDIRRRHGLRADDFLLLFVGRLGREKNLGVLLEAVGPLLKRYPRLRLMLAGDGPERQALERQVNRQGIERKVVFTGVLDRKGVVAAYKTADLFVFSSLTETQGLVISEALSAGLPVAAIRAFGVEQMVEDNVNGLLTQASPDDLCRAIDKLINKPNWLKTLAANAAAGAKQRSAFVKAKELRKIYSRLAGGETDVARLNRRA